MPNQKLPQGQLQAEQRLQRQLGYQFQNSALLRHALTHKSFASLHNERLEFLGDAVLGYVVAAQLFAQFAEESEAVLTMLRAQLVRKLALAELARGLNLGDALLLGVGERNTGGHQRDSVLADGLEAVIGAIFEDGGAERAAAVINQLLASSYATLDPTMAKDSKTRLQEFLQGKGLALPRYSIESLDGAPHAQEFRVRCTVDDLGWSSEGTGTNRRGAEQAAAAVLVAKTEAQNSEQSDG